MIRALVVTTLVSGIGSAAAQVQCGPTDAVMAALRQRYDEVPTVAAEAATGEPVVILVSPSGSWSVLVLVVTEDGRTRACLNASGTRWHALPPSPPGEPS